MLSRVFGKGSIYESLNLGNRYDDHYGNSELYDNGPSHDRTYAFHDRVNRPYRHSRDPTNSAYRHHESNLPDLNEEEANEEVPGSLLVEDRHGNDHPEDIYESFNPAAERVLDDMERGLSPSRRVPTRNPDPTIWLGLIDPKERAMWRWINVENLDVFLQQVCYGLRLHC